MAGRVRLKCSKCGGESVVTTGTLRWDFDKQEFYASSVGEEDYFCDDCDEEVSIIIEENENDPVSGRR